MAALPPVAKNPTTAAVVQDMMLRLAAGETVSIGAQTPEENAQDVADLLDDVLAYFTKYVQFSYPEQAIAVTLWTVYTHCFGYGQPFSWVPYLLATSAEMSSGKTTLVMLASKIAYEPLRAENMSPAMVGREAGGKTLFLDEIDGVYKGRVTDGDGAAMELRGILNGGFNKDGTYARLVQTKGGNFEPHYFPTFGPKMMAGIGRTVPDTVKSRSIRIRLERAVPGALSKARDRFVDALAVPLRERIGLITDKVGVLPFVDELPDGLTSRDEDIWEPLIALADQASGEWPGMARAAAIKLSEAEPYMSTGVRLLHDLRALFEAKGWPAHLSTKEIIGIPQGTYADGTPDNTEPTGLCAVEDFGWSAWTRGRPITPHALGRLLSEFDIGSDRESVGGHGYGPSGYFLSALAPVWERYLSGGGVQAD